VDDITCATPSAKIFFTTDGTLPVYEITELGTIVNGNQYYSPITVSEDTTLVVMAFADGKNSSPLAVGIYEISQETPTTYTLTVQNGTGTGNYAAGTAVPITANSAPAGKVFDKWTTTAGTLANENSASTTITMPASAATVTATYKDAPVSTYTLTVQNGIGSGNYVAGTTVNISANPAPSGQEFDKWTATAGSIANATSASTTFTMPAGAATVTATYKDAPLPPADKTALNNRISELGSIQKGNYTDVTWNAFQTALANAQAVANNASATLEQINNALNSLNTAYAELRENAPPPPPPIKYIFSTKYEATFLNWILFFVCFGWLWMWF